ncbi:hypothetical protein E2C01_020377 [Portunus trituberculatus]|uniref:Uncharacterized protein n=1 Tax=Portunus trituberculatus TaxID=210409 RepID=A0A5B7DZY1_PORTR|nr:hypothetical protein [Portunus trituberculatus]
MHGCLPDPTLTTLPTPTTTRAGFDEADDDYVQDLLESHVEPLSDELIELDKASQEAEKKGDEEEDPVRGLDIKTLRECLGGIEKKLWKP